MESQVNNTKTTGGFVLNGVVYAIENGQVQAVRELPGKPTERIQAAAEAAVMRTLWGQDQEHDISQGQGQERL